MKRMLTLLLALLLLAGCGSQSPADDAQTPATQTEVTEEPLTDSADTQANPFGTFSAQTLEGETITDEIFTQADLTIVNLWGTFCGPCINEMPTLGKLHEELDNVQVLGIVLDCTDQSGNPDPDQVQTALDITAATGANYPTAVLNMELAMLGMANYQYIPTTLFVDGNGDIIGTEHVGALDEDGWRQVIAERLEMIGQ